MAAPARLVDDGRDALRAIRRGDERVRFAEITEHAFAISDRDDRAARPGSKERATSAEKDSDWHAGALAPLCNPSVATLDVRSSADSVMRRNRRGEAETRLALAAGKNRDSRRRYLALPNLFAIRATTEKLVEHSMPETGAANRRAVSLQFSTDAAGPSGQCGFESYHDLYASAADAVRLDETFAVAVTAERLGGMILFDRHMRGIAHMRPHRRVLRNGFDHFTAQIVLEGTLAVGTPEGSRIVGTGECALIDMSQPMETRASRARVMTLSAPRDVIEAAVPEPGRLHGAVLPRGSCPVAWCSCVWSTTMTGRAGLIRLRGLAG